MKRDKMLDMDVFFITGAMGFVGSHFSEYLLKKGKKVIGLDLGPKYTRLMDYDNFTFVQDTIRNDDILRICVDKADCVCHFAGVAEPDQYVTMPRKVIEVTALAGLNLINMCRLSERLFFLTSTSEIYGKNPKIPFAEDDDRVLGSTATNRWCYSSSKGLLEHYLYACATQNELEFVTVRLFNVYGSRLKGRAVSNFVELALQGEPLVVHGDGSQTRAFTYIDDVVEAFDLLINNPECYDKTFNIGNPKETTIMELAEAVREAVGPQTEIRYMDHEDYYGKSYEDINRRVPCIKRIGEHTGWEPRTSLEEGLKKMVAEMRLDS